MLVAVIGVLGFAVRIGSGIELRSDLAEMLPDDAPSVLALEESRRRAGTTDLFTIAVQSPDPMANVRMLDALGEGLSAWPDLDYIEVRHEQAFFREHALLLLPVDDLVRIRDALRELVRRQLAVHNPLYVDLDSAEEREAAAEFDWRRIDVWVDPMTLRELGLSDTDAEELFPFLQRLDEEHDDVDPTLEATRDYRLSDDRTVGMLTARLHGEPTDVTHARDAYDRGVALIDGLDPASFHPEMTVEIVGAYRSFLEVRAVARDVQRATWISIVLVIALLIAFFRSARAVIIVGVPLLAGIVLTLAAARLVLGALNTLTAFVFAIVIGIGIDFAIHLYRRVLEELGAGESAEQACTKALQAMFRPLLSAAATTGVALLTLVLGSFSGFREFGIASALGVLFCFLATIALVPLLVAVLARRVDLPAVRPPPVDGKDVITASLPLRRRAFVLLVIITGVALMAPPAAFEYDFDNLSGPGTGRTVPYELAVGSQRGTAPALMLGETEEQLREAHAFLRERLRAGDPLLRSFFTIENVLPTSFEERLDVLDEILEITERRAVRRIDGDEGAVIDKLRVLSVAEAFVFDDLPLWTQRQLVDRDGHIGRLGLLYIDFPRTDAARMQAFQDAYGEIPTSSGPVQLSSVSFVVADVVRYVQADGRRLPLFVAAALFLLLLVDLRSLRLAVLGVVTVGLAALLARAAMGVLDVKVGLYNMVVLPMVMGLGIDGVIHLIHRIRDLGILRVRDALRTTGVAVLASGLTTAAGFVGLLFTSHLGVRSIGELALIGILAVLVVVLGVLPGALSWLARSRRG